VEHIARYLLDHPEGILTSESFDHIVAKCTDFRELTGEIGDVYLIHPFMLHATSQNPSPRPRFITNPPVGLREPMNFDRRNSDDYSLVERKILNDLGSSWIAFRARGHRDDLSSKG
jgi:hypothetical protein